MTEQIGLDWPEKQPSRTAGVTERPKCCADTKPRTPQHRLEERGEEKGSARQSSLKGRQRAIVEQTGWSAYGLFRAHGYNLKLN